MMLRVLPHFAGFIGPALLVLGATLGGWWTLLPVAFVFGFLPVLDDRVGRGDENPAGHSRGARFLWDLPLWLWTPAQLGLIAFVLRQVTLGEPKWFEAAGLTISLGVVNGSMGIVIAHELMHRAGRFPRALAEILMASLSYAHFCIEHVHGHHRNVATPRDPATSRQGETVFAFLVRSIVGGAVSAWRLEANRVARTKTPAWSPGDARLRMPIVTALMYALVGAAFGISGAVLFFAQGFVAVVLLEITNYLEHYGLERQEVGAGRYETVGPQHSWNSSYLVSNAYLFNLARHSDHHFLASRPYEMLRHWDETEAPQLPAGYPAMLLAALVPPLWFRIMDPRVAAWRRTEAARTATVARR